MEGSDWPVGRVSDGCRLLYFFGFFSGLCGQIEVVRDAWGSCVRLLVWIKKQACTDFRGK